MPCKFLTSLGLISLLTLELNGLGTTALEGQIIPPYFDVDTITNQQVDSPLAELTNTSQHYHDVEHQGDTHQTLASRAKQTTPHTELL